MKDLFSAEILKLTSTRTALGLLIAGLLASIVPAILVLVFVPASGLEEEGAPFTVLLGATIVPTLGLVFGILSMTNEYRHGTITYSYLVTPKRWQVIAVKLVVCFVVGVAVLALVGALLVLVALVGYRIKGLDMDLGSSHGRRCGRDRRPDPRDDGAHGVVRGRRSARSSATSP